MRSLGLAVFLLGTISGSVPCLAHPRAPVDTPRFDFGRLLPRVPPPATFRPGAQRGAFRGTITVRTDDPERPRLVIPYTGEAR